MATQTLAAKKLPHLPMATHNQRVRGNQFFLTNFRIPNEANLSNKHLMQVQLVWHRSDV